MIIVRCDRCSKEATPEGAFAWLNIRSDLRAESDPNEWNLCSWKCLEEWAGSKQLGRKP